MNRKEGKKEDGWNQMWQIISEDGCNTARLACFLPWELLLLASAGACSLLLDLGWPHDFLRPVECSCRDAMASESRLSEVMPLPRPHSCHAASLVLRHVRKAKAPRGSGARQSTAPAEPSPLQVCQLSAATSVIPGKKGCDRPDRPDRPQSCEKQYIVLTTNFHSPLWALSLRNCWASRWRYTAGIEYKEF